MTTSNDNGLPQSETKAISGRNGPSIAFVFLAIIVALALVFFLQNGEKVSIDFLVFEKITTIRWSILMAVVLGVLLDRLATIWWRRRKRKQNTN